jgi:hypothetical protein
LKISFDIDDLTQSDIDSLTPDMYFRVFVCNDDIQNELGTINGYDWPDSHFTLFIPKIIDSNMNSYNSPYDQSDQDYAQRYIKVISSPYVELDSINYFLMTGQSVTLTGKAYDSEGNLIQSGVIGIQDGLGLISTIFSTNSDGSFEYTTTPMQANAALVTFFPEEGILKNNTFVFNVVENPFDTYTNSLAVKNISIKNDSDSQLLCTIQWDNDYFELSQVFIPANSTVEVIAVGEESGFSFPFEANGFIGGTIAGGDGFDADASTVVTTDGKSITTVSGGVVLLRFGTYAVVDPSTGETDGGLCWASGTTVRAATLSANIEAGLCLGSDGISVFVDGSLSHVEVGGTLQIVGW